MVTKLMTETKLPSVTSFKMVLEFINLRRRQFHPLLKVLKPMGELFY